MTANTKLGAKMIRAALAIALMLEVAPAKPQQFDLVCTGAQKTLGLHDYENSLKTVSFELRIDLRAMKYCTDACQGTSSISFADDTSIAFEQAHTEATPERPLLFHYVSRVTGKYAYMTQKYRELYQFTVDADCTPAPFKAFPQVATKF